MRPTQDDTISAMAQVGNEPPPPPPPPPPDPARLPPLVPLEPPRLPELSKTRQLTFLAINLIFKTHYQM